MSVAFTAPVTPPSLSLTVTVLVALSAGSLASGKVQVEVVLITAPPAGAASSTKNS